MEGLYNNSCRKQQIWDKITEIHDANIKLKLERKENDSLFYDDNNENDVEFIIRHDFYPELKLNEDSTYVPRFNIKKYSNPLFAKFPPNKEIKYDRDLMMLAINYGMILQLQYRGAEDDFVQGRQRVIYPMVLGTSSKGKPLLRAYHLKGWSQSQNGKIDKVWRMFRTDRILSMSFTGNFFRLAPAGYSMQDKGMRGGIIVAADFNKIRDNQKTLIENNLIQNKEQINLKDTIEVDETNTKLNLSEPFINPNLNEDDKKLIRLTFLKSTTTNHYIAILGALGEKNKIVKVSNRNKYLGQYKVLKWITGDNLGKPHMKNVEGQLEFDLFIFIKKMNQVEQPKPEEIKQEPIGTQSASQSATQVARKPNKFEEMSKKINKMGQINKDNKNI